MGFQLSMADAILPHQAGVEKNSRETDLGIELGTFCSAVECATAMYRVRYQYAKCYIVIKHLIV